MKKIELEQKLNEIDIKLNRDLKSIDSIKGVSDKSKEIVKASLIESYNSQKDSIIDEKKFSDQDRRDYFSGAKARRNEPASMGFLGNIDTSW